MPCWGGLLGQSAKRCDKGSPCPAIRHNAAAASCSYCEGSRKAVLCWRRAQQGPMRDATRRRRPQQGRNRREKVQRERAAAARPPPLLRAAASRRYCGVHEKSKSCASEELQYGRRNSNRSNKRGAGRRVALRASAARDLPLLRVHGRYCKCRQVTAVTASAVNGSVAVLSDAAIRLQ